LKFTTQTTQALDALKSVGINIHIEPGNKLRVKRPDNTIVAVATVDQEFEDEMSIYDLASLVNILKLFGDQYDIDVADKAMYIRSADGNLEQEFVFTDSTILKVPDPTKADSLFAVPAQLSIDIDENTFGTFMRGLSANEANNILFETIDGEVCLTAAHLNEENGKLTTSSNRFKVNTGIETNDTFRIAIDKAIFIPPLGSYRVEIINSKMIRLVGESLSYVFVAKGFSTYESE